VNDPLHTAKGRYHYREEVMGRLIHGVIKRLVKHPLSIPKMLKIRCKSKYSDVLHHVRPLIPSYPKIEV